MNQNATIPTLIAFAYVSIYYLLFAAVAVHWFMVTQHVWLIQ